MNCCHVQTGRTPQCCGWRGASGAVGSGALLVLLPKCPLCIAAYLALWTGASVAMPVATHLRPLLEMVFAAWVVLLLVKRVVMQARLFFRRVPIDGSSARALCSPLKSTEHLP
jgi:hypothetical protein